MEQKAIGSEIERDIRETCGFNGWQSRTSSMPVIKNKMPPIEATMPPYVCEPTVICFQGNGIDRADTAGCNGKGWRENESYTLNTIDKHAVCYSQDAYDKYSTNDKSASLKAQGGVYGGAARH